MTHLLLPALLACAEAAKQDSAAVDPCPGAPVAQISWSPGDGHDILEIQVASPNFEFMERGDGEFALGLFSAEWDGESCHGPFSDTCVFLDGRALALQTVDSTDEVVVGTSTWFKQDRFEAWALYYDFTLGGRDTQGRGTDWAACVGSGYPDCCTRDSPPLSRR